jgi:hypothetical protein
MADKQIPLQLFSIKAREIGLELGAARDAVHESG